MAAVAVAAALLLCGRVAPLGAEDPSQPQKVTVQPGDTLSDIAVRFYGAAAAVERIVAANQLSNPDHILFGTALLLPPADSAGAPAGRGGSGSAGTRQIVVEPGDTLSLIAERVYGSWVYTPALAALNGIANPDLIVPGTRLTVPATPPSPVVGAAASQSAAQVSRGALGGRRICLDPGHGGREESGAVFDFGDGRLLREADVTLDLARTLSAWLQADGATVTMTRTADTYLGLNERATICNAAAADIAVSLHLNGIDNPAWNGAMALFFKAVDRRLAERLAGTLHLGLSRNAPGQPFTDFGAQRFDGRMLLRTTMPAVIVEPVFLTNPGEARALLAPTSQPNSRRNQIVLETYRGIRMYFAAGQ